MDEAEQGLHQAYTLMTACVSGGGRGGRAFALVTASQEARHGEETLQALRFGEECAMVCNRVVRDNLGSVHSALAAVDHALDQCQGALCRLRAEGREGLPAFRCLQARFLELSRKRAALVV